ncbi:hypothetical protein ZWY2020_003152 [Hordeum vulgare]|nr:hypothetical protein ZWY2020_003152 [Hordeum vulgare]
MTYLSGPGLSIVLNIASVIKNNLGVTIITCTFILQNNAVPQNQRGAANGLAMTGMSFFKAVAPASVDIVSVVHTVLYYDRSAACSGDEDDGELEMVLRNIGFGSVR